MIQALDEIEGGKPALLCLAGNLCSPMVFDRFQVPDFMQKVRLDYLGTPGPWDVDSIGWEIVRFINKLGNIPVILAGYSAGGVIAISAASKSPEQIAGMALSNTGPCSNGHGSPGFALELKEHFGDKAYMRSFLASCFYRAPEEAVLEALWQYARYVKPEAAVEVSASLRQVDYREVLKRYRGPVSVIHGKLDTRRGIDSVEMICASLPQAEVTLLETGHTPMWEDALGYQEALERLIARVFTKGQ